MRRDLDGRVALVTGGSKGIGKAISISLAKEGASVIAAARQAKASQQALNQELEGFNGQVLCIDADVTRRESVHCAIELAAKEFGRLDILVNNAGGADRIAGFFELNKEDWFGAFELNVMSVVYAVEHAAPLLKQSRSGRIVNISSISGVEPGVLVPQYSAAKAAVINLSKHLANLFAVDGILVNVVCPGQVQSPGRMKLAEHVAESRRIEVSEALAEIDARGKAGIPLGRIGEPDDVAGLVTFLASDAASWITGACFHVDGGKHRSVF